MKLTKKERKKCAADFRKAANRISDGKYWLCCNAISNSLSRSLFCELFRQDAKQLGHLNVLWFQAWDECYIDPKVIQRRCLGLELAALLIETGEFPWK